MEDGPRPILPSSWLALAPSSSHPLAPIPPSLLSRPISLSSPHLSSLAHATAWDEPNPSAEAAWDASTGGVNNWDAPVPVASAVVAEDWTAPVAPTSDGWTADPSATVAGSWSSGGAAF